MSPTSQTLPPAASASSPGLANVTYRTATPRRSASARAMSGATPTGSPASVRPVTSRKLLRLIPARRNPSGARSGTCAVDGSVMRFPGRARSGDGAEMIAHRFHARSVDAPHRRRSERMRLETVRAAAQNQSQYRLKRTYVCIIQQDIGDSLENSNAGGGMRIHAVAAHPDAGRRGSDRLSQPAPDHARHPLRRGWGQRRRRPGSWARPCARTWASRW